MNSGSTLCEYFIYLLNDLKSDIAGNIISFSEYKFQIEFLKKKIIELEAQLVIYYVIFFKSFYLPKNLREK